MRCSSARCGWIAGAVLQPAQALRHVGLYAPRVEGDQDIRSPRPGLGPKFSREHTSPVLLEQFTEHDELVSEFDRLSEAYDAYVRPFSTPIFDEALRVLDEILPSDARVLDAGCGPGRELRRVARALHDGEVVGVDLAAGMVVSSQRSARAAGLDNTAHFQADVGDLPVAFDGQFGRGVQLPGASSLPGPGRRDIRDPRGAASRRDLRHRRSRPSLVQRDERRTRQRGRPRLDRIPHTVAISHVARRRGLRPHVLAGVAAGLRPVSWSEGSLTPWVIRWHCRQVDRWQARRSRPSRVRVLDRSQEYPPDTPPTTSTVQRSAREEGRPPRGRDPR